MKQQQHQALIKDKQLGQVIDAIVRLTDAAPAEDELFAAAAVFTLIDRGFAFLYSICQILIPQSFQNPNAAGLQSWLDLLFLSFSLQSATGLSDLIPISPEARVIAMLQMFCGVMYLALIVSRLIALQYIRHLPHHHHDDSSE